MVLAHELSHIVLGHHFDTKLAFNDKLFFPDEQSFQRLDFKRSAADEAAADTKAIELLNNSPYKDKLGNAGLFLKALQQKAPELTTSFVRTWETVLPGVRTFAWPACWLSRRRSSRETPRPDRSSAFGRPHQSRSLDRSGGTLQSQARRSDLRQREDGVRNHSLLPATSRGCPPAAQRKSR